MIVVDGSFGEGGGQIVRSSLGLSMVTGRPVTIHNIRARRKRPGLARQHVTAVRLAQQMCGATVAGAGVGSRQLVFEPGPIQPGEYHHDVGTAGSTTLVLQTVLPALMTAPASSKLVLSGGTHNPMAPPFEFLANVYGPLVERMGPRIRLQLVRPGFYPAGGGRLEANISPAEQLAGFELLQRGKLLRRHVRAIVSNLPLHIAEREGKTIVRKLAWPRDGYTVEEVDATGPGNVVLVELQFEHLSEIFVGFGQKGVTAERVAAGVAREVKQYLDSPAPVGEHLADQLLLPLGIAASQGSGVGSFRTLPLSDHATTHIEVLKMFLEIAVDVESNEDETVTVRVRK